MANSAATFCATIKSVLGDSTVVLVAELLGEQFICCVVVKGAREKMLFASREFGDRPNRWVASAPASVVVGLKRAACSKAAVVTAVARLDIRRWGSKPARGGKAFRSTLLKRRKIEVALFKINQNQSNERTIPIDHAHWWNLLLLLLNQRTSVVAVVVVVVVRRRYASVQIENGARMLEHFVLFQVRQRSTSENCMIWNQKDILINYL
jgi:hypothetical protein